MTIRDDVIEGRLNVAALDANEIVAAIAVLVAKPPTGGTDQEEQMRYLESSIASALYHANRLKVWAAKEQAK